MPAAFPGRTAPVATLRAEHDDLARLLDALTGLVEIIEGGRRVPVEDVRDALDTLVALGEECHHAKEEHVLFPALDARRDPLAARVLRELKADHLALHKLLTKLRELAPAIGEGSTSTPSAQRFAHTARLYTQVLDAHMQHEADLLFPLVEATLDPVALEEVARDFERVEASEVGRGRHARFEDVIDRLSAAYGHTSAPRLS